VTGISIPFALQVYYMVIYTAGYQSLHHFMYCTYAVSVLIATYYYYCCCCYEASFMLKLSIFFHSLIFSILQPHPIIDIQNLYN
jgi:hypothetical protein